MKKVIISADSTCDLGPVLIEKNNIDIIPLHILLDGKDYKDTIDINPEFIFNYYDQNKVLPTTSAPNVQEYIDHFSKWENEEVVHFSIGSALSSSFQNSYIASQDMENVYTIDAKNITTGIGILILKAVDLANEGKSAAEIKEFIEGLVEKSSVQFVVDNLLFLKEGGRVSALAATSANVLSIKPSIKVNTKAGGKLEVNKKYRGSLKKVLSKFVTDIFEDGDQVDPSNVFITHSLEDLSILDHVKEEIAKHIEFEEITITNAGSTISSHCGRNTLGIIFLNK